MRPWATLKWGGNRLKSITNLLEWPMLIPPFQVSGPLPQLLPHPEAPQPFFFWPKMLTQPKFSPHCIPHPGAPSCAGATATWLEFMLLWLVWRWPVGLAGSPETWDGCGGSFFLPHQLVPCRSSAWGGRPVQAFHTAADLTGSGAGRLSTKIKIM